MKEFTAGARATVPVALSVFVYGSVLGILAAGKGISLGALVFMDLFMFAGSAQFVLVQIWDPGVDLPSMVLAVVTINLRYFLIGASLYRIFEGRSFFQKASMMHLVADENWAVTMAEMKKRPLGPLFLLGGGICLCLFWTAGTVLGYSFGALIASPEAWALDFVFPAVFLTLVMSFWDGKSTAIPWICAFAGSWAGWGWLPGKWYILVGGLGGALAGVVQMALFEKEVHHAD